MKDATLVVTIQPKHAKEVLELVIGTCFSLTQTEPDQLLLEVDTDSFVSTLEPILDYVSTHPGTKIESC